MTANPIPAAPSRPVLYRVNMQGRWWPGVSRACGNCIGGFLLDGGDNVHCLQCAHEAYTVKDAPRRPLDLGVFETPKRGRPPKAEAPGDETRVPQGACRNGHERNRETAYFDRHGRAVCRVCKRSFGDRRRAELRAITHCPNGHEYTPENVYIDRKGYRKCRTCRNTLSARRHLRSGAQA